MVCSSYVIKVLLLVAVALGIGNALAQSPVGSFGLLINKNALQTLGSSVFDTVTSQLTATKLPPAGGAFFCAGNVRISHPLRQITIQN